MAGAGISVGEMGGRVEAEGLPINCFLQGWKDDEDEDVNIESSDESVQGNVDVLKKISESASTGVAGSEGAQYKGSSAISQNKGAMFLETSSAETSGTGGQAVVSGFDRRSKYKKISSFSGEPVQERQHSTNVPLQSHGGRCARGTNVIDKHSQHATQMLRAKVADEEATTATSPVVRSSHKAMVQPSGEPKEKRNERLDARKFRNAFAAKFSGSKSLKNGTAVQDSVANGLRGGLFPVKGGKQLEGTHPGFTTQTVSSGSLELSAGKSFATGGTSEKIEINIDDQVQGKILQGSEKQILVNTGFDPLVSTKCESVTKIRSGSKDEYDEEEGYVVFRRRRNNSTGARKAKENKTHISGDQPLEEEKTVENSKASKGMHSSDATAFITPGKTSGIIARSEDRSPGRSKRARKDNMQKDYIPWSAFGRSPVKRSEKLRGDGVQHSKKPVEKEWKKHETIFIAENVDKDLENNGMAAGAKQSENNKVDGNETVKKSEANKNKEMQVTRKRKFESCSLGDLELTPGTTVRHDNAIQESDKLPEHGQLKPSCKKNKAAPVIKEQIPVTGGNKDESCIVPDVHIEERSIEDEDGKDENHSIKKGVYDGKASGNTGSEESCDYELGSHSKERMKHIAKVVETDILEGIAEENGSMLPEAEGALVQATHSDKMSETGVPRESSGEHLKHNQWVKCVMCKQHRRIPLDVIVDEAIWCCRDNTWDPLHAKCGIAEEKELGVCNDSVRALVTGAELEASADVGCIVQLEVAKDQDVNHSVDGRPLPDNAGNDLISKSSSIIKDGNLEDIRSDQTPVERPDEESEDSVFDAVEGTSVFCPGDKLAAEKQGISKEKDSRTEPFTLHCHEENTADEQFNSDCWKKNTDMGKELIDEDSRSDIDESQSPIDDLNYSHEDYCNTDNHNSFCEKCGIGGDLLCCDGKGCKITYHIGCLDPPLTDVPADDWYCPDCAYKKFSSGVYAVSKGIESIWDVKEGKPIQVAAALEDGDICMDSGSLHPFPADGEFPQNKESEEKSGGPGLALPTDGEMADISGQRILVSVRQQMTTTILDERDDPMQYEEMQALRMDQRPVAMQSESRSIGNQHLKESESTCEKHYFVKYKRVAHVHNQWIPESQLLKEAPKLLAYFKRKVEEKKAVKWNPEWAEPCRIIGKKWTAPPKRPATGRGRGNGYMPNHCLEWFVKWKCLGYEHCTWEAADTSVLTSPEAIDLIKDYEARCEEARQRASPEKEAIVESLRTSPFQKLETQPHWIQARKLYPQQLGALNEMRKYWQKGTNGIVIDEAKQERTITTIAFLLSLFKEFEIGRPVIVVTPPATIINWEVEFTRWAAALNIVTYSGTKEARDIIQRHAFHNEDGHLMVQIVLTSPDVVSSDFDFLNGLKWEALVVDECQRLKSSRTSRSLHQLMSNYRLLLFSEPFKNNWEEYHQFLSLVETGTESLVDIDSAKQRQQSQEEDELLADLKTRLGNHIVYEYKHDIFGSTRLKEYWLPVEMTSVQVEEHCKLLIERYDTLNVTRNKRVDGLSSLQEIVLKLRECCNHPYLVNPGLQESLTGLTGKELLDLGIKASGKLQLLDMLLAEAKLEGRRVVIITQMHLRSEKISLMDILDDYVRQQFGVDSYERVDVGLAVHKKQAAVQRFNAKDSRCFVFLLDKRACGPSIKLSSVNHVIFFDSDFNLQSDIQALQRVRFDCQFKDIRIYRFYSSRSVEERILIAGRRNSELDGNYKSFSASVCQRLLRWGVRENLKLFDRLLGKNNHINRVNDIVYTKSNLKLFFGQASMELSKSTPETYQWKTALEPREAGSYGKGLPLYTETDEELTEEDVVSALEFWSDVLKDRQIEQQDGQGRGLRARKKVQYCEDTTTTSTPNEASNDDEDEVRRKRRKISDTPGLVLASFGPKSGRNALMDKDTNVDPYTCQKCSTFTDRPSHVNKINSSGRSNVQIGRTAVTDCSHRQPDLDGGARNRPLIDGDSDAGGIEGSNEGGRSVRTEQQWLLLGMKPDLHKLCQTLQLQEHVAKHAERLLSFLVNNFKLPKDSKSLLHAVELSVVWLAAEQHNYFMDQSATQALAESCFGLQFFKSQVDSVYSKLKEQCSQWKRGSLIEQSVTHSQGSHQESRGQEKHQFEKGPTPNLNLDLPHDATVLQKEIRSSRQLHGSHLTPEQQPVAVVLKNAAVSCEAGVQSASLERQEPTNTLESQNLQECRMGQDQSSQNHFQPAHSTERTRNISIEQESQILSPEIISSMREAVFNQRAERMQLLLNNQKTQIRKLDNYEKVMKEKLRRQHETICSRIMSSNERDELKVGILARQKRAHAERQKDLDRDLTERRRRLVEEQFADRYKEKRIIACYLDKINSGQMPSPLPRLDNNANEINETDVITAHPVCSQVGSVIGALVVSSVCTTVVQRDIQNVNPPQDAVAMPTVAYQVQHLIAGQQTENVCPENHVSSLAGQEAHLNPDRVSNLQNYSEQAIASQVQAGSSQVAFSNGGDRERTLSEDHTVTGLTSSVLGEGRGTNLSVREELGIPTASLQQGCMFQMLQQQQQQTSQFFGQQHHADGTAHLEADQAQQASGAMADLAFSNQQVQLEQQLAHNEQAHQNNIPSSLSCPTSFGQHGHMDLQPSVSNIGSVGSSATTSLPAVPVNYGIPAFLSAPSRMSTSTLSSSGAPSATRLLQTMAPSRLAQQYHDPLYQEWARLRREQEKVKSSYEAEKERLKSQCVKELEAVKRKFDSLLQEEEHAFSQKASILEVNLKKVDMNRRLADTFKMKCGPDNMPSIISGFTVGMASVGGQSQMQNRQQRTLPVNPRSSAPLQPVLPATTVDLNRCNLHSSFISAAGGSSQSILEQGGIPITVPRVSAGVFPSNIPLEGALGQVGTSAHLGQVQTGLRPQTTQAGTTAVSTGQSRSFFHGHSQNSYLFEGNDLLSSRSTSQLIGQSTEPSHRSPPFMSSLVPSLNSIRHPFNMGVQNQVPASNVQGIHNLNSLYINACTQASSPGRNSISSVSTYSTTVASHSSVSLAPPLINIPASGQFSISALQEAAVAQENLASSALDVTPAGIFTVNDLPVCSIMVDVPTQHHPLLEPQELRIVDSRPVLPSGPTVCGQQNELTATGASAVQGEIARISPRAEASDQGISENTAGNIDVTSVIYLSDDD